MYMFTSTVEIRLGFSPVVGRLAPQCARESVSEKGEIMNSPSLAVSPVSNSVDGALRWF